MSFKTSITNLTNEFELEKTKFLLLFLLLTIMGMMSILTQAFLPDLLKLAGYEQIGGPKATTIVDVLIDFWGDYLILMIIILLLGSTTFSPEVDVNKQVYFNLSRPISRKEYYLTRVLLKVISLMTIFFVASTFVYVVALNFFNSIDFGRFVLANLVLTLHLGSFFAITILLNTRFNSAVTAVIGLFVLIIGLFLSLISPLKWFSTIALSNEWINIINNTLNFSDLLLVMLSLLIWLLVPIILGLRLYQNRDL